MNLALVLAMGTYVQGAASGTIAITALGDRYAGVPADLECTATGDVAYVVWSYDIGAGEVTIETVSSAPWTSEDWTPGSAVSTTVYARAYAADDTLLDTDSAVVVVAEPEVVIVSPAVESAFATGVSGAISGTVVPADTAVAVHDHDTGTKIGDAVVVGESWSFSWTATVDQYGVVSVDARTAYSQSDPLAVRVVTWPHTLFGADARDWYYGWLGATVVGGKITGLASFGVNGTALAPSAVEHAPAATTTPGVYGGRQHIDYGSSNDHTMHLRSNTGAYAQPEILFWHGTRTAGVATNKVVHDGEDSTPRRLIYSNTTDGTTWMVSAGTAVDTGIPVEGEKTLVFLANGAAGQCDYIDSDYVWHDGSAINAGTGAREGCTAGNRYSAPDAATGMGCTVAFWGYAAKDALTADEKTQFLRWLEVALEGLPFA